MDQQTFEYTSGFEMESRDAPFHVRHRNREQLSDDQLPDGSQKRVDELEKNDFIDDGGKILAWSKSWNQYLRYGAPYYRASRAG